MSPSEIEKHRHAAPFKPFRIHVSDGASYDIRQPHHLYVTQRQIVVGIGPAKDGIPTTSAYIDPLHVTRLEPILARSRRGSNGHGPSKR